MGLLSDLIALNKLISHSVYCFIPTHPFQFQLHEYTILSRRRDNYKLVKIN